jgi:hypothetical protein
MADLLLHILLDLMTYDAVHTNGPLTSYSAKTATVAQWRKSF